MSRVYFFGCWRRGVPGHYFFNERGATLWTDHGAPWDGAYDLDGTLCPGPGQVEGLATLSHKDGWTALAFWDRSGDGRGNSNSAFVAEGTHDFAAMVALGRERFHHIWARFPFEVRLAGESAAPAQGGSTTKGPSR